MLTCNIRSQPMHQSLGYAWRQHLQQQKGRLNQTFMSQPCPPRPDSRTPAASLMRGWNTSLHTLTLSGPSIYKFSPLARWQPQSRWSVICELPVWGCYKVSMQLKIHFLLPTWQITVLSHWIDTHIYSHTCTYIAFVTHIHTIELIMLWKKRQLLIDSIVSAWKGLKHFHSLEEIFAATVRLGTCNHHLLCALIQK